MKQFLGLTASISSFVSFLGRFFAMSLLAVSLSNLSKGLISIPQKLIFGILYFFWPKQSRRRYRTVIFAVFLFAFLAANFNYPKYWNDFADWVNPKLDSIDMPQSVAKLDRWYIFKTFDDILNVPHFLDIPFSRGLDLRGGIHLIYEADLSQVESGNYEDSMNGLRDVIERRVNLFGVREPQVLVQKAGDEYRLLVELAGITDFSEAVKIIGQTPYLEFKELRPLSEQKRILREFFKKENIQVETESGAAVDVETQVTDEQLEGYCENISPNLIAAAGRSQGEDPCFQSFSPPLTGKYLKDSNLQFDSQTNVPLVILNLDDEGAKIFEEATARNVDKPLAVYLDGILISWPKVQEKISGGTAQITGFDIDGAKTLARNLNAGALPVPISLLSQQFIGASLGEESLQKSFRAAIVGLIAVVLFMVILYKMSGALGILALMIYLALLFGIFKAIPVTLTLPGIAGLILSIGMAVDANVLVFERLREEMSRKEDGEGKNFLLILNHAYSRAWPSIRDGNMSTLLTCVILFWFSTSFVKGFALTLGIGIVISMFSAMVVTKYLMRLLGERGWGRKTWLWVR